MRPPRDITGARPAPTKRPGAAGAPSAKLGDLVSHAEALLRPGRFKDYPGAVNGLQFENRGRVTRIAAAVDGTLEVARKAVAAGADLLLVHHGLFWGPTTPWTGRRAALLRLLVENDVAVYSQHLPLDGHPRLGNAACLARAMGWSRLRPFLEHEGMPIGVQVVLPRPVPRAAVAALLARVTGAPPRILPGGPDACRRIGVCTGGAGSEIPKARAAGVDTLITGEGPHWTYALAEDCGLNAFYAGHYATETFGVKALADEWSRRFGIPWVFVDHPTGL